MTGTIVCTEGEDTGEEYRIAGSFRNLILPLIYESSDRSKTDRGALTLKLIRNAERFEGKLAVYNTEEDAIGDVDVIWFRSKDQLDAFAAELEKREEQTKRFRERMREARNARHELTDVDTTQKKDAPPVKEQPLPPTDQTPNQAMQRTASKAATEA